MDSKIKIDLTELDIEIYNKIAIWHNESYENSELRKKALIIVCRTITQEILETVSEAMGAKSELDIQRGGKNIYKIQEEESKQKSGDKKDIFDTIFNKYI